MPCPAGHLPRPGCTLTANSKCFVLDGLSALELGLELSVSSLELRLLELLLSVCMLQHLVRQFRFAALQLQAMATDKETS